MNHKIKCSNITRMSCLFLMVLVFFNIMFANFFFPKASGEDTTEETRRLLNGSFEDGPSFTSAYKQPAQAEVPYWNTTAFQGKIELFRDNPSTYFPGMRLTPTDGTYAAELNADEESTLYQNIKTTPSSIYEWGLDHGARNGTDTMALIIGPKQSVDPSKPSKAGRDQLMQMADWIIEKNLTSVKTSAGMGEHITLYSKKFAASGAFEDNAGNNPFSLTPSTIYTEKWEIWIMASSKGTSGENPWNSYGSNDEGSSGSGSSGLDKSKYYLYTVPPKQTDTLFGFVSVGYVDSSAPAGKEKTFGNFLDNINFEIYHKLSGSTSNHGSAIISSSDGSSGGSGGSTGHEITIDNNLATYVTDGQTLEIQAVIKAQDAEEGCQFLGAYYTRLDQNGEPVSSFINLAGNVIDYSESLTDEEKRGKWVKSVAENGDIVYKYYLENIITATDLHFVFIKHPTVTYDSNGGQPYIISDRPHPEEEAENVYSFKPVGKSINGESFIKPYVSKAAEGYDGWKFMGWKMIGDIVDNIPSGIELVNADQGEGMLLPAVHSIACDYKINGIVQSDTKAQYFKIYDGNISFNKALDTGESEEILGVTWNYGGATKLYANVHRGITMVAQWRWRQAFIPQIVQNGVSINSTEGGTVEITSVADPTDENYNDAYTELGGKAYYAAMDETVLVRAVANPGCTFLGWYDENDNLISTNAEYGYVETKGSVKTYYAKFSNIVTQTYIRQIKNGDIWEDTTDDNIGTLGRYSYEDAVGSPISSTANVGAGYRFIGWYDSEGNKVPSEMITNNGTTIEYITTGDATYYARYEKAYTLHVSKVDEDDRGPLAGAEFTLYEMDDNGDQTITYGGASIKCIKIGSGTTALTKDGAKALAIFTDSLLTGRDYYIVETKPPFGYNILNDVTKISFVDTDADENGIYTIEIENQIGIRLPATGGIGTVIFTVIGVLMIGAAVLLLASKKKFEAKERK